MRLVFVLQLKNKIELMNLQYLLIIYEPAHLFIKSAHVFDAALNVQI